MTQLESAMAALMDTFDKYAGAELPKDSLSKAELRRLLEKELPVLIEGAQSKGNVDKLLQDLDANGDSQVDFTEFVMMVSTVTALCHGIRTEMMQQYTQ